MKFRYVFFSFLLVQASVHAMELEPNYFEQLPKELVKEIAQQLIDVSGEKDLLKNWQSFVKTCKQFNKQGNPVFSNNDRLITTYAKKGKLRLVFLMTHEDSIQKPFVAGALGAMEWIKKEIKKDESFIEKNGFDLLSGAAAGNRLDVIKFMIDNKADINSKNNLGSTPLTFAVRCGSLEAAKLLMSYGAVNNNKYLGLQNLANISKNSEMIELLEQKEKELKIKQSK